MAFIEFHVLQNFAPSNLNRDDTNTPKSCIFGGFKRARISSQSQKRQIRLHPVFKKSVEAHAGDLGERTKKVVIYLRDHLIAQGNSEEQSALAAENLLALVDLKVAKDAKKPLGTQYLLYLGKDDIAELKAIAEHHFDNLQVEAKENKAKNKDLIKQVKAVFTRDTYAADVALFGRMMADDKNMNVDAACQVAHAISTHEVKNEMDFFTAVDDGLEGSEQGSGMMGMVGFNSACYYRYAQINLPILQKNLGGDKAQVLGAVLGFYKALLAATPSGKQNSFAAHNPACYIRATIKTGGSPWPLTNAFAKPVRVSASENLGLEEKSVAALENQFNQIKAMYSAEGIVLDKAATMFAVEGSEHLLDSVAELEAALLSGLNEVVE